MQFSKDHVYRLTELDNCFVIGHAQAVVPSKTAKPLIIADTDVMIEYLSRYLWARAKEGRTYQEAHEIALKYAGVIHIRKPEVVL